MPASSDPTSFSYGTPAGPDTEDLTGATSTNSLGGIFNSGSTSALQTLSIVITNILSDNKKIAFEPYGVQFTLSDGTTGYSALHYATTIELGGLNILDDVVITGTPSDNQPLAYNTATSKWINQTLAFDGIDPAAIIIESEGISSNDNDITLPTSAAVKDYVDTHVTSQDLDFQGDTGGTLSIDLDSEVLDIAGGTGINTAGAVNTLTVNIDDTVVTKIDEQTLTNKTLTTPIIASLKQSGSYTLTMPAATDTLVGKATTDTLTNKTLTTPVISSISNSGTVTIPSGADTLVGRATTDTLTNKTLTTPVITSISNSGTVTIPSGADTLVARTSTDTLTNKTLTSPVLDTGISGTAFQDDDAFSSASASKVASSESIKAYVDSVAEGLDVKDSVKVATTANITLANTQTIDGVSLSAGDRVLVKDQSTGSQNGVYVVVDGGSWTRATDFDSNTEVTDGTFFFVEQGTVHSDSGWVLTTNNPITVGTTALVFSQFSGAGQITAGAGLTKSGNTINVVGTADKITVSADAITIASGYVGQSSIETLGTIGTGTWQGSAVADGYISSASTWNSKQAGDAGLTSISGLTTAADKMIYTTGSDTYAVTSLTAAGREILDDADAAAQRTTLGLAIGSDVQAALTFGIANTNAVKIDDADAADDDYARFTASGVEGRSYSEVKTDLSLGNVENTALSTWAGSSNITTLGTLGQDVVLKTNDGAILTLQTSETTIVVDDSFGSIQWQSPSESSGGKSQDVTAKIEVLATTTFSDTENLSAFEFHLHEAYVNTVLTKVATLDPYGRYTLHGLPTSAGTSDPHIIFERAGSDNGAEVGTIFWKADLSTGSQSTYAEIQAKIVDSDVSERDGSLHFKVSGDGSTANVDILKLERGLATVTGNLDITGDIVLEGATANGYETTLTVTDPTADRTITLPDATGTVITTGNPNAITDIGVQQYDIQLGAGADLQFEGATANAHETTLTVVDPTADRTVKLPNATGTLGELLITSGSVSDVASIAFNNTIMTTDFTGYRIEIFNVLAVTDQVVAYVRLGYNNTAETSLYYRYTSYWAGGYASDGTYNAGYSTDNADTQFQLNNNTYGKLSNVASEHGHFNFVLPNASSSSSRKMMSAEGSMIYSYFPMWQQAQYWVGIQTASVMKDNPINYFDFLLSSGNIASADYRVYGRV